MAGATISSTSICSRCMRDGRIGVLYSSKDYSSEWGYHPDSKRFQSVDNTKFAVNIVVYALTA